MTALDRRNFLRRTAALGGGALITPSLGGLTLWSDSAAASTLRRRDNGGYGDLVQSVDCPELWIPRGLPRRAAQPVEDSVAGRSIVHRTERDGRHGRVPAAERQHPADPQSRDGQSCKPG